jgi:hypothetical protein
MASMNMAVVALSEQKLAGHHIVWDSVKCQKIVEAEHTVGDSNLGYNLQWCKLVVERKETGPDKTGFLRPCSDNWHD